MLLCFFDLNTQRLMDPWVIAGLAIMIVGVLLVICANSLSNYVSKLLLAKGKTVKVNIKLIIIIVALAIAFAGGITAILMA